MNMNDRQIARSDDSDFIAKRLREALSVGRATMSETSEELTTAANPNGNNLQFIKVPQTMWDSLSQRNGQRQIYNDPSADLPSHRHNSYDYNFSLKKISTQLICQNQFFQFFFPPFGKFIKTIQLQ
ncbi:unnamed protein product [Thelazia callipaeda]|uniref:Uncharacterized protein n=1 Tax=Thelazia callipaeda TaxID=103827 RepID=A0A0N5DCG6_THECL|nr:unnamed protein product [Thelazia callipaeda]